MEQEDKAEWLAHYYLEHHAQRFWNELNTGEVDLERVPLAELTGEVARNLHPDVFGACDFENHLVPSIVLLGFEQMLYLRVKEWFDHTKNGDGSSF